jgi:beta-phosphoglucomutase-like phosphatase (HAD superfamily)
MDGAIPKTSFLFDLDGTLVDSVYQHVRAWRKAPDVEGINVSVWRIHRKIGMSGGLFTSMLLRETGFHVDPERSERLRALHAAAFNRQSTAFARSPAPVSSLAISLTARALGQSQRVEGWKPREVFWKNLMSISTALRS